MCWYLYIVLTVSEDWGHLHKEEQKRCSTEAHNSVWYKEDKKRFRLGNLGFSKCAGTGVQKLNTCTVKCKSVKKFLNTVNCWNKNVNSYPEFVHVIKKESTLRQGKAYHYYLL